jgi:hypothetical protein
LLVAHQSNDREVHVAPLGEPNVFVEPHGLPVLAQHISAASEDER